MLGKDNTLVYFTKSTQVLSLEYVLHETMKLVWPFKDEGTNKMEELV